MSRDIFVQDILADVTEVKDIPSDWMPNPLPYTHGEIIATIQRVVPSADFSDPDWAISRAKAFRSRSTSSARSRCVPSPSTILT